MNAHLKQLTDLKADLEDKIGILEDEKVDREREIGKLRHDLEKSEHEKSSISGQLEATQEALKVAELSYKGQWNILLYISLLKLVIMG
jgi:chromosome segregation ATPase